MTLPQHFTIGDFTLNVASGGGSAFMVEGFADENAIFNPPDAQGQANMRIGPDGIQYSTDRQVEVQPLSFVLEPNSPFFTQHAASLEQAKVRGVAPPYWHVRAEHLGTGQVTRYQNCLIDSYGSFPAIGRGEIAAGDVTITFFVNPLNIFSEGVRIAPARREPVENTFQI